MTSALEDLGFTVGELYVTPIDMFYVKYSKILIRCRFSSRIYAI